jgi:hypothetical protein
MLISRMRESLASKNSAISFETGSTFVLEANMKITSLTFFLGSKSCNVQKGVAWKISISI